MNNNQMYSKLPNLVLGFHGCDEDVYEAVIKNRQPLLPSNHNYDWLGNGIYFWENNSARAYEWAASNKKIKNPCVVGAVIDLGNCLNLVESQNSALLKIGYDVLKKDTEDMGGVLPENKGEEPDKATRNLDCAVIERLHQITKTDKLPEYDSVRGAFVEGDPVYPGTTFREKTHIQICIINPNCIKGYFDPLEKNEAYSIP